MTDVQSIHAAFVNSSYGAKRDEIRRLRRVRVQSVRRVTERLMFLVVSDSVTRPTSTSTTTATTSSTLSSPLDRFASHIQVILKVRDGFVDVDQIRDVVALLESCAFTNVELDAECFVERDATVSDVAGDGSDGLCPVVLHAMSLDFFVDDNAAPLLRVRRKESPIVSPTTAASVSTTSASTSTSTTATSSTTSRRRTSGSVKRDRAPKFAHFVLSVLGIDALRRGGGVLDVAGGAGALSYEFTVRRGISCVCIDPRPTKVVLLLASYTSLC